ncbi:MAG: phosphotransferase [Bacilli bacterium]
MENIKDIYGIPDSIFKYLEGLSYEIDNIGKSNSGVIIFEDYILKITTLSFDLQNEMKVYYALKGKLPIPDIIEYEEVGEKAFILKTKLKGKMLCDGEYLSNPNLLFKLATDAVKLLWSVNIEQLNLQNTFDTIMNFGKYCVEKNYINFQDTDKCITYKFNSFNEIVDYLENNKPSQDYVLSHGDLCLTNIIVQNDKIVGFIDLGLTGISHRYHDLAILYRSIKYNMLGKYGKKYDGFNENAIFELLGVAKDDKLIEYFLLLDELLG